MERHDRLVAMTILVLDAKADPDVGYGVCRKSIKSRTPCPEERQTLLFSATMPTDLARLHRPA